MFVWEPAVVKINALKAATEAACTILSIDETVRNPKAEQEEQQRRIKKSIPTAGRRRWQSTRWFRQELLWHIGRIINNKHNKLSISVSPSSRISKHPTIIKIGFIQLLYSHPEHSNFHNCLQYCPHCSFATILTVYAFSPHAIIIWWTLSAHWATGWLHVFLSVITVLSVAITSLFFLLFWFWSIFYNVGAQFLFISVWDDDAASPDTFFWSGSAALCCDTFLFSVLRHPVDVNTPHLSSALHMLRTVLPSYSIPFVQLKY